jgi:hypothetical protein
MLSESSAPVAPVEHRAGRCATGVGVSFVTTCVTTTVVSQTITVAAPSKIFVIANGLFENNLTQSGSGGGALVALVDSSNTAVALTESIEVSVPGNASGASEQFLTQGVLGHPHDGPCAWRGGRSLLASVAGPSLVTSGGGKAAPAWQIAEVLTANCEANFRSR